MRTGEILFAGLELAVAAANAIEAAAQAVVGNVAAAALFGILAIAFALLAARDYNRATAEDR